MSEYLQSEGSAPRRRMTVNASTASVKPSSSGRAGAKAATRVCSLVAFAVLCGCSSSTPKPSPYPADWSSKVGATTVSTEPVSLVYRAPTSAPANRLNVFVTNPAVNLIDAVQEAADDLGVTVVQRGYDRPVEIAYSGPAVEFVDCGEWLASTGGSYPATTPVLDYRLRTDPEAYIRRAVALEIRGGLEEQGRGTNVRRVSLSPSYTVTRTIQTFDRRGESIAKTESVTFSVEGRAAFPDGLMCQPSGALERSLLSRL